MSKAFAYLRVSGKGQVDGDGFPRQRAAIEAYAQANNIEVVEWFEEKGVSGKTDWDNRPAWTDMISRLNGVRTIIVEKLDRLARDLFIQEYILRDLGKREVVLKTAAGEETGDEDATRVLFRQILGAIAQYDRTMIVNKLKSARDRASEAAGKRIEGKKAYGATPAETSAIDEMMLMRERGASYDDIARNLNGRQIATRHGRTWHPMTVRKILNAQAPALEVA